MRIYLRLLLLPQRYVFSSKSQRFLFLSVPCASCCCYHKGTYFQANHNNKFLDRAFACVVVATTKVRIFKQITTAGGLNAQGKELLLLPQRYVFSSKSQRADYDLIMGARCCCYHKGTYFQANHN